MDGILLIDKTEHMTSRDCVNLIMRQFNMRKIGHTGTLDPFASGLMLITMGKATKAGPFIEDLDKTYEATLALGQRTDTLDLDGTVIEEQAVPFLDETIIRNCLQSFVGILEQIPPMYSALKYRGQPLYKYARAGLEIERSSRQITIYEMELLSFTDTSISFRVRCSKGTYVRTLGEQIANCLHTVGHLTQLRRTAIGRFKIEEAHKVSEAEAGDILMVSDVLSHMPTLVLSDTQAIKDIKDGKLLTADYDCELLFIKDYENGALAIYQRCGYQLYRSLRGLF